MKRDIKNFQLQLGNVAMTPIKRNKKILIEVAYYKDDNIRGLFSYDTGDYISGNIPKEDVESLVDSVKWNHIFFNV